MATVTTEDGEFTAPTLGEAAKMARAEQRAAAKRQRVYDENRELAYRKAVNTAYLLCRWTLKGQRIPWEYMDIDKALHNGYVALDAQGCVTVTSITFDGVTEPTRLVNLQVVGILMDTGGWIRAVAIRIDGTDILGAVAAHDSVTAYEELPDAVLQHVK